MIPQVQALGFPLGALRCGIGSISLRNATCSHPDLSTVQWSSNPSGLKRLLSGVPVPHGGKDRLFSPCTSTLSSRLLKLMPFVCYLSMAVRPPMKTTTDLIQISRPVSPNPPQSAAAKVCRPLRSPIERLSWEEMDHQKCWAQWVSPLVGYGVFKTWERHALTTPFKIVRDRRYPQTQLG